MEEGGGGGRGRTTTTTDDDGRTGENKAARALDPAGQENKAIGI